MAMMVIETRTLELRTVVAMLTAAEEWAFLPGILAQPKDDGPRLILADYLEESDDPRDHARAEFIRVQIALGRLPAEHPRRRDLLNRQNDLLLRHLSTWTHSLRGLASGFEFRRGLLDSVTVDVATFASRGEQLFALAPIRRVRFLDANREMAQLMSCPLLARVKELDLCGSDLGNGGVNLLLRSPHLQELESLDLSFNGIADGALDLLAGSRTFPKLRVLALNDNGAISSEGVQAITQSAQLQQLRRLDLSGNDVCEEGVRRLATAGALPHLHTLKLHTNRIQDEGVRHLVNSDLFTRLLQREPHLDLRHNGITFSGVQSLAASPRCRLLRSLDLSGNLLTDSGLAHLAFSEFLGKLESLLVARNRITDDGAVLLANSPLMKQLKHLDVSANSITQIGLDALWHNRRDWQTVLAFAGNLQSGLGPSHRPFDS